MSPEQAARPFTARRTSFPALLVLFGWAAAAGALAASPRVVLISVDGLRPDAITADRAPHMAALRAAGAQARLALNDLPSATLPNHTTMLTGLVSDVHGVLLDFELCGYVRLPTVFDHAAEAGLRSAFFASKAKLRYLAPPGSLETVDIGSDTEALVARLIEQIAPDGPDLIFLHLREPDSTGHDAGWMSPPYLEAVTRVDALVGRIQAALDTENSRRNYLLLTADHGGEGTNHFLNTPAARHIPWIVVGPDIPAGVGLDEIVSIADTTPTALWLLGVDVPAGLSGRARTALMNPLTAEPTAVPRLPPVGIPCMVLAVPVLAVPGLFLAAIASVRTRPSGSQINGCRVNGRKRRPPSSPTLPPNPETRYP